MTTGCVDDKNGYLVSKSYSLFVFSLLFLLYMFDYLDRLVIVSLFPSLQRDWGLTDTQCGSLVSAVYWSILVFSFPISLLIDRWSRKKSIGLMAVLWSLATGASAFTHSFRQLFTVRVAVGIGEAGYAPGGTAMLSALFPENKRAMFMGIWNASIPLGSALGMIIGGLVAEYFGWRHAFGLVAFPGLIVAVLFFFVKDYKTVKLRSDVETEGPRPLGDRARQTGLVVVRLFKTPSLLLTYLAFAGNTFVTTALLSWLPTYFYRIDSLPMSKASMKGSVVMMLAMVGAPLGGYLADKWGCYRDNARMIFAGITSLATAALLFASFGLTEGNLSYGLLLGAGLTAVMFLPAGAAVTQDVVHPGVRATSYSLCVVVQHILGSSIGPVFVGSMSDHYDISVALTILPVFGAIAGLLFLAGSIFYVKDLNSVDRVELSLEDEA